MSLLSPSTCQSPSRLLVDYFSPFSSRLLRSSMCKPVRFTPCVSHRAFHTVRFTNPCHLGASPIRGKKIGDLIDTHAQVIDTWDHISPKVRANLAYAVDPPCSRSSWRRLILAQAYPGTGPGRGSRDSSIFDMHDLVLYHAPTTDFTQTIYVLRGFKPRVDKKKSLLCGTVRDSCAG